MSISKKKPNFFIVGAPKSGTTSLYYYLSKHPDVLMSKIKEPCFLAPDFYSPRYPKSEDEYLDYFEGFEGQSRIGEATSTYLYSRQAAQRIYSFSPNCKIIMMLRNPVDMVLSLHAQRLKEGDETIYDIEKAFDAEADRRKGKFIPASFNYPKEYLLYRDYGKYAEQIKRYISIFGEEKIHVVLFDDFIRSTKKEYIKVCKFLNIKEHELRLYVAKNTAKIPRSVFLHRVYRLINPYVDKAIELLKPTIPEHIGRYLWQLYNLPKQKNLKPGRPLIKQSTKRNLIKFFERDISELESLIDRDLSSWKIQA
jgi:hypothetical protein